MANQNVITWFEIPVADMERARKFYGTILSADLPKMEMGLVTLAMLPGTKEDSLGGALISGNGTAPSALGTTVFLNGGKDLRAVLDRVEPAGGKVIVGKTKIPEGDFGYFARFQDSEGNHVALHSKN
jgi:predicted enzyme related to lactoylglutathione lyase